MRPFRIKAGESIYLVIDTYIIKDSMKLLVVNEDTKNLQTMTVYGKFLGFDYEQR